MRSSSAMRSSSGTLLCLASATAFGAMAVFGKLAYAEGATVGTLLAARFTLAAGLFWIVVGISRPRRIGRRDLLLALASAPPATRARPARTSPRSRGSTRRFSPCSSTRSRRS